MQTSDHQQTGPTFDLRPTVLSAQPVRLRLACDACSIAKIKCDKNRPRCERCTTNGLQCTYSASRRHGKQSWAKRVACEKRMAEAAAAQAAKEHVVGQQPSNPSLGLPTPVERSADGADYLGYEGTDMAPFQLSENILLQPFDYSEEDFRLIDFDWDGTQLQMPSISLNSSASPGRIPGPATVTSTTNSSESSNSNHINSTSPKQQRNITSSQKTSPETFEITIPLSKPHDCEARIFKILQSLHYCPMYFLTQQEQEQGNRNPNTHEQRPQAPGLDQVLFANRAALANVTKLLDCQCAQRPHFAFLHLSVLSKVLCWYKVAANGLSDLSRKRRSQEHTTDDCSSPSSDFRDVCFTSIKVGVFDLDEASQISVQRGILLAELQKVEKVIERMARLCFVFESTGSSDGMLKAGPWYELMIPELRKELKDIIQIMKHP